MGKAAAGVAVAAAAVTMLASPAQAATATVTTTFHHPFYDITQSAFVDADHLQPGDELQSTNGATAQVTSTRLFHATATTYDLTIDGLHTYYVEAGNAPVLVHNCGNGALAAARAQADMASSIRPGDVRPAVAEAIQSADGSITYSSGSVRRGAPSLHPDIQSILDRIPEEERGVGHGSCGLAVCMSQALTDGNDPTGWNAAAVLVRGSMANPKHGCLSVLVGAAHQLSMPTPFNFWRVGPDGFVRAGC